MLFGEEAEYIESKQQMYFCLLQILWRRYLAVCSALFKHCKYMHLPVLHITYGSH